MICFPELRHYGATVLSNGGDTMGSRILTAMKPCQPSTMQEVNDSMALTPDLHLGRASPLPDHDLLPKGSVEKQFGAAAFGGKILRGVFRTGFSAAFIVRKQSMRWYASPTSSLQNRLDRSSSTDPEARPTRP